MIFIESRRLLESLLLDRQDKALVIGIEFESVPRNRKELVTHSHKTAKRHYGIGDASGRHIDHDVFDFPEMLARFILHPVVLERIGCHHAWTWSVAFEIGGVGLFPALP